MSAVFLKLLNLGITASWLILAVILVRFLLKKAPKWINCVLWALVAIRLICPFSLESALSLVPSSETVNTTHFSARPYIQSGVDVIDNAANNYLGSHYFEGVTFAPRDSLTNPINVISIIWIIGMATMLLYALISYIRLKKSVGASVPVRDNILACDEAKSPFILGIIKPVIYVPSSMTDPTLDYVITHEAAHIKRHDHWWKPFGFLLLAVYWFNPLCWLAYILLCRDIEMACDEKVIREFDNNDKAAYSQALLNCSFPRRRIAACPLAFGEVGVKERVKSALNYKKPAFWIIAVAVVACIVVAVCFGTNPAGTVLTKWDTDTVDMNKVLDDVRSLSVQYWNSSVDCNDSETNRFLATMGKIKVGSKPISISRDEGRSAVFIITINEHLKLNFNESFNEIWVDNGVKPSYTYKITNPSTAEELLLDFNFMVYEDTGIVAKSGKNNTPVVVFPVGTPISDIKDRVFWLDIAPDPDELIPFTIYCDGYEQHGMYNIYDAETTESLDYFHPSGLSEQTYLFQNAEYGHDYIVTLHTEPGDLLCFGARIGNASAIGKDGSGSVTANIRIDVCELYLEVLEDLWNVDSGLNDGISQIGIDLSELSHLTELEKETVMHEFASKHNLPYIAGTWEELCEQGYIDKDNLYWEDGLFFSIKTNEDAEWNLPALKEGDSVPELTAFDAQKWRSGLGAYFFGQCTAQKNADGKWSYTVGQEAIS